MTIDGSCQMKVSVPVNTELNIIVPVRQKSHGLNGSRKPLKRPFDRYQSCFEAINNGRDIRQINW